MSRTTLARCLLLSMLGWGVLAGQTWALGPGSPLFPWAALYGTPEFPRTPPGATELPPGHPPVDNSPSKNPLHDWWHRGRPLGCWASFNGYGCSSFHSEMAFIFGSCRTFFSEPCLKGAPPSAQPPWAGQESGYYPGGAAVPGLGLPPHPSTTPTGRPGCPFCR